MENFICVVKGVSSSGKSSRTLMVLKYLKSKYINTQISIANPNGKMCEIGTYFPECRNLLIIGKEFMSGKVEKFQGYDMHTSAFGGASGMSEWLKKHKDDFSPLIEGAGITKTHRLRPKFLYEECGYKNTLMQYYNFRETDYEVYNQRVIGRSGKPCGLQMWEKTRTFIKEVEVSEQEGNEINQNTFVFGEFYDSPIDNLGLVLSQTFLIDVIDPEEFIEFCTKEDYVSKNLFVNQ